MPATIIDSAIFGNIFSTEAMRAVWSDENRTEKYLDIERALASVQARLGIIPAGGRRRDRAQLRHRQDRHGQARRRPSGSAIPFSASSRNSTRFAATSSASIATGARRRRTSPTRRPCCRCARRSRSSMTIWRPSRPALANLARRHRDTPMVGRSNLQQAIPITFGYKMAACWPRSSGIATGSTSCARASWSASSPAPPARSPRSNAAHSKRRPA